jgi:hypothetical protein
MRKTAICAALATTAGLLLAGAAPAFAADEPKSEGQPHKWAAIDKSLYDLVADGFDLVNVVYEPPRGGAATDLPEVHYFLQKEREVARCDFHKRENTSYYYCFTLSKPGG